MKSKKEIFDLLSLLKVFDANYVSDDDCTKLHGLDVNDPEDVARAVNMLLMPELVTYLSSDQIELTSLLRTFLADSSEDFKELFDRVALAFDDEIMNKRAFMTALLAGIEASQATKQ